MRVLSAQRIRLPPPVRPLAVPVAITTRPGRVAHPRRSIEVLVPAFTQVSNLRLVVPDMTSSRPGSAKRKNLVGSGHGGSVRHVEVLWMDGARAPFLREVRACQCPVPL